MKFNVNRICDKVHSGYGVGVGVGVGVGGGRGATASPNILAKYII